MGTITIRLEVEGSLIDDPLGSCPNCGEPLSESDTERMDADGWNDDTVFILSCEYCGSVFEANMTDLAWFEVTDELEDDQASDDDLDGIENDLAFDTEDDDEA